jgi:hypothetical protein
VVLDNWFPVEGKVTVRPGYTSFATGVGSGDVNTLHQYHVGTNQKLLAASSTNIYNITSGGAASSLKSGFTNGKWDTANFNNISVFVNGADTPQQYNGTGITAMTWTGSGLTPSNLAGVNVYKSRLYFWEDHSQSFWYGDVNAITGTLTEFSLNRVAKFGGDIIAMGTWTHDGGDGSDDHAAFILSSGDVVVYMGDNPGSAASWALVGVYNIGQPLNKRAIVKTGGDLLIATTEDYVSMSAVLRTGQVGASSKICVAVRDASQSQGQGTFGWQGMVYRKGNMVIFNVPRSDGTYHQHVMNPTTGAWCRFTDIDSNCWAEFNTDCYFGSSGGIVYKFDSGNLDDTTEINADGQQAWQDFGVPYDKRLSAARTVISSQGNIAYEMGVGFDFSAAVVGAASAVASDGSAWDTSPWDTTPWSAGETVDLNWRAIGGYGHSLSPRVKASGKQAISWLRTDVRAEVGQAF